MHMRMAFCIEKRNFPSLIFKEYLDITHLDEQEILGKGLKLMSESQYSMVKNVQNGSNVSCEIIGF